jgi:shikimate kinase
MEKPPRLTPDRNLVLIGYRASGKTSVGRALAERLVRDFVDLDEVLVAEAGCDIAQLVAKEGWPGFRRREKELVRRYALKGGQVLAPGGGVVLDPENVALLREHGVVIWITAPAAVLRERLQADAATAAQRPGLTGGDAALEIDQVLAEREPLYRSAAHLVVDTAFCSVTEVAEEILRLLPDN